MNTATNRVHLAVSMPEIGKHKTLQDEFIPLARKGKVDDWTATRKFAPGDLVLFYFGEPVKAIMGIGFVASQPETETGRYYWTKRRSATLCNFKPVKLLDNPVPLEAAAKSAGLADWYATQPYRSSREIDPSVAEALLSQVVGFNPDSATFLQARGVILRKTKRPPLPVYSEGGVYEVTTELRRRDSRLRTQAIAEYGYQCQVCGFNFADFYGDLGAGYIEVHHLRPLSEPNREHTTTVKDVTVVCANCHRVLHRSGKKPISVTKLKAVILQRNSKCTSG